MHEVQRDVAEFNRVVVGIDDPTTPAVRLVAVIDGLCDLLCVVYGAAAEFGVDLAPFWDEVHRTNMAKAGGPLREDGKRLKPPGWVPPDIAGVLATLNGTDQPKERVG